MKPDWIIAGLVLICLVVGAALLVPATENLVTSDYMTNETAPEAEATSENLTGPLPQTTAVETPQFSGTISSGSNRSSALTEDQAWHYAEAYSESRGLTDIQPDEVKSYGPKVFTDKEKDQRLVWTFKIDRKDSMGFEQGGIIAIDAYNGEVVWYAAYG